MKSGAGILPVDDTQSFGFMIKGNLDDARIGCQANFTKWSKTCP